MNPLLENTLRMKLVPSALIIPIHDSRVAGTVAVAASETSPRRTTKCFSKSGLTVSCKSPGGLGRVVLPVHRPCSQSSAEKSDAGGMGIWYWTGGLSLAARVAQKSAQIKAGISTRNRALVSSFIFFSANGEAISPDPWL